jgi:DNA end-binding protein Ku
MAARAIWKGVIHFGDVSVPVKLYSAAQDHDVHFHMLHERDQVRVRQRMVHPGTGDEVPSGEIRRGYEAEPGVFVLLDKEELEELTPAASRDIEVTHFVAPSAIDQAWYVRPYYLGPDGDETRYSALAVALEREERVGIAHWVMRKKQYSGALHAREGRLVLVTMRAAEEVVDVSQLEAPGGRALDKRELQLAEQLVSALTGDFEPEQFRDEHRDRVLELIELKRKGGTVKKPRVARKEAPSSLASALTASLKHVRKEKKSA